MKVAIVGGIGTGKSTIVRKLQPHMSGYEFYSVDEIVEDLYDNPKFVDFLARLNIVNKQHASDICFENPYIRQLLEEQTEPLVKEELDKILARPNVVVEFPLLFKYPAYTEEFDVIVLVDADVETRIERIKARNGFTEEKICAIIDAQASGGSEELRSKADIIYYNNGSIAPISIKLLAEKIIGLGTTAEELTKQTDLKAKSVLAQIQEGTSRAKIGVMPGSFDPITLGHVYLAGKALDIVDVLHIVIASNAGKNSLLHVREKCELIKKSILEVHGPESMSRVRVDVLPEGELLISHAQKIGAKFLFRGLRNSIDLEYEHSINFAQKVKDPSIETIYLLTPQKYTQVSSSLVRSLYKLRGSEAILEQCVTNAVFKYLTTRPDRYK